MLGNSELVIRLVVAAILGGVIGFERERKSWVAGLRTHMLASVGAALIMIVSSFGFADALHADHVVLDPSRMAAQVVSGIGFLGAGAILLRGEVVRGLTTAASLWVVAAIGLAVGGGMYMAAIVATIIILLVLVALKPLERRFVTDRQQRRITIQVKHGALTFHSLHEMLGVHSTQVKQFIVQQDAREVDLDEAAIVLHRISQPQYEEIRETLRHLPGVKALLEDDAPGGN